MKKEGTGVKVKKAVDEEGTRMKRPVCAVWLEKCVACEWGPGMAH